MGVSSYKLSRSEQLETKRIATTLRNIESPDQYGLPMVIEALRRLLRSPIMLGYRLRHGDKRIEFERFTGSSEAGAKHVQKVENLLDKPMATGRIDFAAYNPLAPQPEQRNQPLTLSMVRKWRGDKPIPTSECFPEIIGSHEFDHVRVVVCEGASMLGWVGAIRVEQYSPRELAILQVLTPHLQSRMKIERDMEGVTNSNILQAVLDSFAGAAFVLGPTGAVLHANERGIQLWTQDAAQLLSSLRDAVNWPESQNRFQLSPLRMPGMKTHFVAVQRLPGIGAEQKVEVACRLWSLTRRQRQVLELISIGRSNKAIAAELNIAEVTVETHVTALFARAQVGSRAELIARVWQQS